MAVLQSSDYDIYYFDGGKTLYQSNAGYADYHKWYRINDDFLPHEESTGEYWADMAKMLVDKYNLVGKKVLEIGCAKGYVVENLRDMGVDAYGLDVSEYAISQARKDIQPYLIQADARTYLSNFATNEFDFLFSRWTLECFDDADVPIKEMNRISKLQLHSIDATIKPEYYNRKPIESWLAMDWDKGTILSSNAHFKTEVVK